MKLKYKQKILKLLIILLAVFWININNGFTAEMRQSLLSPLSNIDAGSLQKTFTYLVNQETYSEYKAIFEINTDAKPVRSLKAQDLTEFLQVIKDVRIIVEIFSQGNAFDWLMNSGEQEFIDDLLAEPPEEINLIQDDLVRKKLSVIMKSVSQQLASRERVQPSLAATMYKELISRLKRKLETALSMIKPSMPIQSITFNQQILAYLSPATIQRIIENINWQNHDPDDYSGQRKIILHLDQPIILDNGVIINSLEIKGVVFKQADQIFPPLSEKFNALAIVESDKQNSVTVDRNIRLKGGLPFSSAKREYMVLERLSAQENKQYDYPVAYGMYKNYTFRGKQFGFVVTGVENSKRIRIYDWFLVKYSKVLDLIASDKIRFSKMAVDLFEIHELFLREYGKELRRLHDAGVYHKFPHMLNVSWDKEYKNIVLNDFESSKVISALAVGKRVNHRLMDINSAYVHFIAFITRDNDVTELSRFSREMNSLGNPFRYFLKGYFAQEQDDYDFTQFLTAAIASLGNQDFSLLELTDQDVLRKLFEFEGADYEKFNHINRFIINDQTLISESICSQAI